MRERRDLHVEAAAGRLRERQHRRLTIIRVPGSSVCSNSGRPSHSWLAGRVGPDAHRLFRRALAVVGLLHDVEDRVVVELHRRVVPHAGHRRRRPGGCPGCSASPTGRTPHERSRVPFHRSGVTSKRLAARPRASPPRIPSARSGIVSNITRPCLRMNCRGSSNAGIAPVHVRSKAIAVLRRLGDHAHLVQRLDDLDPERSDASCPCGRRARCDARSTRCLPPRAHARERVLRREVRGTAPSR